MSALQKKGYLLLEASEGDKREKRIVLTESGQVYAHRMIAPLRKAEEKFIEQSGTNGSKPCVKFLTFSIFSLKES